MRLAYFVVLILCASVGLRAQGFHFLTEEQILEAVELSRTKRSYSVTLNARPRPGEFTVHVVGPQAAIAAQGMARNLIVTDLTYSFPDVSMEMRLNLLRVSADPAPPRFNGIGWIVTRAPKRMKLKIERTNEVIDPVFIDRHPKAWRASGLRLESAAITGVFNGARLPTEDFAVVIETVGGEKVYRVTSAQRQKIR
jgi:hypothetical protein